MGTTDKGKVIFPLNAGKSESDITDNSTSFSYGSHATKKTEAYVSTSVNPVFVQNNLQYENSVSGSSMKASVNFMEIRKTSHAGMISNEHHDRIGNRIFPQNRTMTSFGKNSENTHSFKIKVYDSQSTNSETNRKFVYHPNSDYPATEEVGLDIDDYDYFILINPRIHIMGTTDNRPHFAKIKKITTFESLVMVWNSAQHTQAQFQWTQSLRFTRGRSRQIPI